ncbi:hypothetical protein [Streptomyces sp. V3I7]|uniref:hypothetical protein n=1 Tax=Streptomyces sp. V3I7 TaxID=3042278 RepID=UPI00278A893F|nr:hypothetical protein [Streptomyces sp. V3I7]MDQ0989328.1 hypothetical protein [Streptomyces sp. V3I7]
MTSTVGMCGSFTLGGGFAFGWQQSIGVEDGGRGRRGRGPRGSWSGPLSPIAAALTGLSTALGRGNGAVAVTSGGALLPPGLLTYR